MYVICFADTPNSLDGSQGHAAVKAPSVHSEETVASIYEGCKGMGDRALWLLVRRKKKAQRLPCQLLKNCMLSCGMKGRAAAARVASKPLTRRTVMCQGNAKSTIHKLRAGTYLDHCHREALSSAFTRTVVSILQAQTGIPLIQTNLLSAALLAGVG